jgi:FkbM family methyltransferase
MQDGQAAVRGGAMEGDECYRFSTIRNFICQTGAPPVRLVLDIGAYRGDVSLLARSYFPGAFVCALEADEQWFRVARENTGHDPQVRVVQRALTAQHLYRDDFGAKPLRHPAALRLWRPEGSEGASLVLADGDPAASATGYTAGYRLSSAALRPVTLSRLLPAVLRLAKAPEIDIMKMDCEGCEHSSLGTASLNDLARIRFIVGEYHYFSRFYRVLERKLFETHKVHLSGDRFLGCFFAERRDGTSDGILRHDNGNVFGFRPELADYPVEWHEFEERYLHGECL